MLVKVLSIIAVLLSLLGQYLVAYKKRVIFVVWGISNILWIIIDILEYPNFYQILMYVAFTGLNINGWINWRKNEQRDSRSN